MRQLARLLGAIAACVAILVARSEAWRRSAAICGSAALATLAVCATASAAPGDRDHTFNGSGIVEPWGAPTDFFVSAARAVAVQNDGKIIVVGRAKNADSQRAFGVVRLNPNGTLDRSFGTGGRVVISPAGGEWEASAVRIVSDGIIVAGPSLSAAGSTGVVKLTSSGQPDPGFGSAGKTTIADSFTALTVSNGRPVLLVNSDPNGGVPSSPNGQLVRLTRAGQPDSSFGGTGTVTFSFPAYDRVDWASVVAGPSGSVIVGGGAGPKDAHGYFFALARITGSGQVDTTFGNSGIEVVDEGGGPSTNELSSLNYIHDLARAPDGSLVACGIVSWTGRRPDNSYGQVEHAGTGVMLAHFATSGTPRAKTLVARSHFSTLTVEAKGLAMARDGSAFGLVLENEDDNVYRYVLVRIAPSGAFDAHFGPNGLASANFGTYLGPAGFDQAIGVGADAQGRPLVAGIEDNPRPYKPRGAVMRLLAPRASGIRLTVSRQGKGAGKVTSTPAGISCGTTCTHNFAAGTTVKLTATPAKGSTFSGWSGACTGKAGCQVKMSVARTVIATFKKKT